MARGNRTASRGQRGQWAYVFNSAAVRNPTAARANSRGSRRSGRSSQRSRSSNRGRGRGRGNSQRGRARGRGNRASATSGRSIVARVRKAAPMEPSGFVSGDLGNLSAGVRHDVVAILDSVVKGSKTSSVSARRLAFATALGEPILTLDKSKTPVGRIWSPNVANAVVKGVTIKFDPGFFRSGLYGQVAVLAVQNKAQMLAHDSYDKLVAAVGATRIWNWPTVPFETTIPMQNWHKGKDPQDEDDDTHWTVMVGTRLVKRDPSIEDDDEVLKVSVRWLLDCPKKM